MSRLPSHIGTYEVVRALGKGGMGTVYIARDPVIDRLVAVKLLREELDSAELRERFAREARSAGRLRHQNIVTIFHVGEHETHPFIVMEYIPGETFAALIAQQAELPVTRKLRLIEDLCRGLAYAHKSGIVHRDIKPANVLVDHDGTVKILDFGIARVGEQGLTQLGTIMGTLNYMSPEQINQGVADHRSDVFAVGLVMYELLTYRRAFPGDNFAVLQNIVYSEPEPLATLCPDLDSDVVAIVHRALAKQADARYQQLSDMAADLARVRKQLHAGDDERIDEGPITLVLESVSGADSATVSAGVPASHVRRQVARANELLELARTKVGERAWAEARALVEEIERLEIPDDVREQLAPDVDAVRRDAEAGEERAAQVQRSLDRTRQQLAVGALDAARQSLAEAMAIAPDDSRVLAVQGALRSAEAAEKRRREQVQKVDAAIRTARAAGDRGDWPGALAALNAIGTVDGTIKSDTLQRLRADAEALTARYTASLHLDVARAAIDAGRYDQANAEMARARAADPAHPHLDEIAAGLSAAIASAHGTEATRALDGPRRRDGSIVDDLDDVSADETVLLPSQKRTRAPVQPPAAPVPAARREAKPAPRAAAPSRGGLPGWAIPAAGVFFLLVIGVGTWLYTRSDSTASSAPPQASSTTAAAPTPPPSEPAPPASVPEPPAPAAPPPMDVEPIRQRVTAAISRDDLEGALVAVVERGDEAAKELPLRIELDRVVSASRSAASRAFEAAQRANASRNAPGDYKAGVARRNAGAEAERSGRPVDAARSFIEARDLLTRAAAARPPAEPPQVAVNKPQPPQQPVQPPTQPPAAQPPVSTAPTPAPKPTPQAEVPPATTTVPAAPAAVKPPPAAPPVTPPPAPAKPLPQAPDTARDTGAVKATLDQWAAGYVARDPAAVRRVYPSAPASLERTLSDARSYEVTLSNVQIAVNGDVATVKCTRRIQFLPNRARMQDVTTETTIELRRAANGWVITAVQ